MIVHEKQINKEGRDCQKKKSPFCNVISYSKQLKGKNISDNKKHAAHCPYKRLEALDECPKEMF